MSRRLELRGAVRYAGGPVVKPEYHNTGLYDVYRAPNTGLGSHTAMAEDVGKFRAPTLRNIAITAPYMHDGSIATLEAVIEHYSVGGRSRLQPNRSPILKPLQLTVAEKQDLIEFLRSLTDEELRKDPRWRNPW
jgi:cytochrome c peroxidase